jgi:hypothetical protein
MRSSHLSPTSTIDIHEIGVLDAGLFSKLAGWAHIGGHVRIAFEPALR